MDSWVGKQVSRTKQTHIEDEYVNLITKKFNNEQKLDDFIAWTRCDASQG